MIREIAINSGKEKIMSDDSMNIHKDDLLSNPTNRIPIGLCLDVSPSMTGDPIVELNEGVELFFNALKADRVARLSAEVAIVTFATSAQVVLDFQSMERIDTAPKVEVGGDSTNLGSGVSLALDILEDRKNVYKKAGIDYFQPWLVLMTDGQPTSNEHLQSAPRTSSLEREGKLVVFPIGIGPGADMTVLSMFSDKRPALRLKGLSFPEFFEWLSKSVARVSQSRPGEKVQLDIDGIKGWAEI
jgi:uncharacterized protein YegL